MKSLKNFFAKKNVRVLSLAALAALAFSTNAEAQITTGLTTAATEITKYIPLVQKICYAIAGLIFLVGGLSIFAKMNNGDQDVKSSIMMYVGGALFLIIVGSIAPTLFR